MILADYLQLLDFAPIALLVADEKDEILYANKIAEATFFQELKQKEVKHIFSYSKAKWAEIMKTSKEKGSYSFNDSIRKLTGGSIDVNVTCKPIKFIDDQVFVYYIQDVTDQQKIIKELYKEQQYTQTILDSIPALVYVKDLENRIVSVNRAFEETTKLTNEFVQGRSLSELTSDQELAIDFWKDDLKVIKSDIPLRKLIKPLFNDPNRKFITDKIPYKTYDGETVGIIGFSTEVTDRVNLENALLESERNFRLLFNTSPEGAIISSIDGRIIMANATLCKMLHYTEEELTKLSLFDITPKNKREVEASTLQLSILFGDTIEPVERSYLRKDGSILPAMVKGWIIKNEIGTPTLIGAFIRDITNEKIAEKKKNEFYEKEIERLKNEIDSKNREMISKLAQISEKDGQLKKVLRNLDNVVQNPPASIINELENILEEAKKDNIEVLWPEIELTFEKINKSFFDNLYKKHPKLTKNEKKITALLRMNMSSREISRITHQNIRSVEMARTRLRKKLNLKRSDNLVAFLSQF
ncbi:MAG TPA: PAS domain S-box protein [Bacteroidales bacterium]|nr:PAS domain S-box protein [Bacteroidales bacterium]HQH14028.1 PAS domain S-box protein [Bacteroidales bacterium]